MPPVRKIAPLFLFVATVAACSEAGYEPPSGLHEFRGKKALLASEAPAAPVKSMSSAEIGKFVPSDAAGAMVTTGGVVRKRQRVAVTAPAAPQPPAPEYVNIVVLESPLMTGE